MQRQKKRSPQTYSQGFNISKWTIDALTWKLKEQSALYWGKPELKHFDFVSESQAALTVICSSWLWMCFLKKQVRHHLQQLRSGTAHTPSSLHSITQQQNWKAGYQCIHLHTHTAQLIRVKERGSRGQVCKPHTTSRVTKVTKGMYTRPVPFFTPAFLSVQTGGKHSITQGALDNLFVSLRKENTGKHYYN